MASIDNNIYKGSDYYYKERMAEIDEKETKELGEAISGLLKIFLLGEMNQPTEVITNNTTNITCNNYYILSPLLTYVK